MRAEIKKRSEENKEFQGKIEVLKEIKEKMGVKNNNNEGEDINKYVVAEEKNEENVEISPEIVEVNIFLVMFH